MTRIILPGDPDFNIATPPPTDGDRLFVVRPGSLLMEAVSSAEMDEYLLSGEYDDRISEMEQWEDWDEAG
jgi:hypothetical protein